MTGVQSRHSKSCAEGSWRRGGAAAIACLAMGVVFCAPPVAAETLVEALRPRRLLLALDNSLDEGHTFSVQFSTDQGRTWHTVAVGLREPRFEIDRSQFREGQELQVRVITTNGLSSSVVMSEPFRV